MIACDRCDDWFHGECIRINEKESEFIDLYFCTKCSKGKKNGLFMYANIHLSLKSQESRRYGNQNVLIPHVIKLQELAPPWVMSRNIALIHAVCRLHELDWNGSK